MKKHQPRRLLLHTNKYQRRLIIPIISVSLFAMFLTFLCLEFYLAKLTNTGVMILNVDITQLKLLIPASLIGVSATLLFIIFWIFYVSNLMIGPYDRIVRELDEIIEGKRKGPLHLRNKDDMFAGLLRRINILIEKKNS